METLLFLSLYSSVSVLYLILGVRHPSKNIKASLKCLPILGLISWFLYQWILIPNPSYQTTLRLTLFALVCSITGDAFLVGHFKFSLPLGIAAFSLAQILYSLILSSFYISNVSVSVIVSSAIIVLIVCVVVLLLVSSKLKTLLYKMDEYRMLLTSLILLYFVLISSMLWSSICLYIHLATTSAMLGLFGGVLFYVSDLCIVLSAIFESWIFKRRVIVMVTYYASQFFMTMGILGLCNDVQE